MDIMGLVDRINKEPSLLLVGQSYDTDLLNQMERAININSDKGYLNYDDFFEKLYQSEINKEEIKKNIQPLLNNIQPAEQIKGISQLRWSSIFTSSINTSYTECFNSYGRKFVEVFANQNSPRDYLSKIVLHTTYLYGNLSSNTNFIPLSFDEKIDADDAANDLLKLISGLILNYGLLVIDGYDITADWIDASVLFKSLNKLQAGSVYWFGINARNLDNKYIENLISKGILVTEKDCLYDVLRKEGLIQEGDFDEIELEDGVEYTLNKKLYSIPYAVYHEASSYISLPVDSDIRKRRTRNKEKLFDTFLEESSIKPFWPAYSNEIYCKRTVDDVLLDSVYVECGKDTYDSKIILLSGANCAGKTTTLGNLAYTLKKAGKYPVIFIPKDTRLKKHLDELNRFISSQFEGLMKCKKTIIIWDRNAYGDEIKEFIQFRKELVETYNRNIVLVGSCYDVFIDDIRLIYHPISPQLDDTEFREFDRIFQLFSSKYDVVIEKMKSVGQDNKAHLLNILHRTFEQVHANLNTGVVNESDSAERDMAREFESSFEDSKYYPFEKFFKENHRVKKDTSRVKFVDLIKELMEILAVAGQFDIGLPLDLLLRMVETGADKYSLAKAMDRNTMSYVAGSDSGDYVVYYRYPLEADLYLNDRFPEREKEEVEVLKRIIKNAHFNTYYRSEASYVLDLIKQFSPNGRRKKQYRSFYIDIANTIKDKMIRDGEETPQLVLQMSNFIREYFRREEYSVDKKQEMLKAVDFMRRVLQDMREKNQKNQTYVSLLVELATNLSNFIFISGISEQESMLYYQELLESLKEAKKLDPANYPPIDQYLYAILAAYNKETDVNIKNNFLVDMVQVIDSAILASPDFEYRTEFQKIRSIINDLYNDAKMSEEYFQKLIDMDSTVGIYFKVKKILGDFNISDDLESDMDTKNVEAAIELLDKYEYLVIKDHRCLLLLIQLKWTFWTKANIFSQNKLQRKVFLNDSQWKKLQALCNSYLLLQDKIELSLPYFILAVYSFIIYKDIDAQSYFDFAKKRPGPRKNPVYFVYCDEEKNPCLYKDAKVISDKGYNRYYAEVAGHSMPIYFKTNLFLNQMLSFERGASLGNVMIGFNVYGPVILPYNKNQEEEK